VIGALVTTLFLGGWQIPPVTDRVELRVVLEFLTFFAKAYFWVLVAIWVRATLPRVRIDQLMTVCWKYLVPLSFLNILGVALWVVLWPQGNRVAEYAMLVLVAGIVATFAWRVLFHLRRARVREQGILYLSPFA